MKVNKIIIHAADTPPNMDIGVSEIRDWHVNGNGWRDVGYHYVIRRDGSIEKGRLDDTAGAHVRGQNADSLGICLVGGKGGCNYTASQWKALEGLVQTLLAQHTGATVYGHNDFDGSKECPCFDAKAWAQTLDY